MNRKTLTAGAGAIIVLLLGLLLYLRNRPDGIGPELVAREPFRWAHLEGSHVMVHSRSRPALAGISRLAEYAYVEVGRRLELAPAPMKAQLYVIENSNEWARLLRESDLRADGLALHRENEMVMRQSPTLIEIPHEMVHLRLRQQFSGEIPLWLDEGLAGYLAWKILEDFKAPDTKLVKAVSPLAQGQEIDLDELTRMTKYPLTEEEARSFYRQTEEWMAALAESLGPEKLAGFVRLAAPGGADWKTLLRERFGYRDEQMNALLQDYHRRLARTQED